MRSFEERKAEVFRRSENRIKERRKARSRALTVCNMLNDHILIDNAAKKEAVLTEEQYVQLLQALGVVLKKEDGK